jgi:serine/threonine protein phosphatase PrpC
MRFECVSRTHVGLRRKVNEDSIMVSSDSGLWAVADGMGGHEAGDVASNKVAKALWNLSPDEDIEMFAGTAIAALQRANDELLELARSDLRPKTIGSTVVALVIAGDEFRCMWAGDSRAYRVRGETIVQLTRDHSLVQELVASGMMTAEEADGHPDANVITRAVGVAETLKVDTSSGEVKPGDIFLLGSDGLTRLVNDRELCEELTLFSLEDAADHMIKTVLERGAPDNVSLIIVKVE